MNALPHIIACATCMPDESTDVARASSMAILFMVAVVFAMLGLFVKIMFNFARRQREVQTLPQ